jgi:hypothetical protein
MRLAFIPSCHSESKPKFLGLQTKVPTRRNATHPLKIHTQPSDDKSDFVQPPPKRNREPGLETGNIPQPDRELPPKQAQKVMSPLVIIYKKNVLLHAALYFFTQTSCELHICTY